MDMRSLKKLYREVKVLLEERDNLRAIMKKPGGVHLSEVGKTAIHTWLERGLSQTQVARLLDIDPSAVSRHVNSLDLPHALGD